MLRDSGGVPSDERQVFQLRIDVLAYPHQLEALQQLAGEAMFGAPGDHAGPCRIAWSASVAGAVPDEEESGAQMAEDEASAIREDLQQIPVWSRVAVDRSLGLS